MRFPFKKTTFTLKFSSHPTDRCLFKRSSFFQDFQSISQLENGNPKLELFSLLEESFIESLCTVFENGQKSIIMQ